MGRALVVGGTLIILAAIIIGAIVWATRDKKPFKGDLSRRQEIRQQELLESAASVMFHLDTPTNLSQFNILTDDTRVAVEQWRQQYSKYLKEVTGA